MSCIMSGAMSKGPRPVAWITWKDAFDAGAPPTKAWDHGKTMVKAPWPELCDGKDQLSSGAKAAACIEAAICIGTFSRTVSASTTMKLSRSANRAFSAL